ncbi:MAG: hypothetical protein DRP35_11440 [Candidatus Zixiibacteriota bacterium]|nr:MAG: hypothetical protein DRP35_11440 [candidate division Zixibacteria bacterium]
MSLTKGQTTKKEGFQLNNYFNTSMTQDQRQAIYKQIANYSAKIRQSPEEPANYINRGVCYANMGLYPDAISDYNHALKIDSLLPEAYYNRGIARGRFRYTKSACIDIYRAYKLGLTQAKDLFDNKCGMYQTTLAIKD